VSRQLSLKQCPKCDARFRGDIRVCPIDGVALSAPLDPFVGRVVAGRYVVEELLGIGGMGSVYRARHQFIGRSVALKFLDSSFTSNDRLRKRFLGEARAANQINHEHIIDITDFGETEDGIIYMVMEYLEGHSLEWEIERGPVDIRRALRIARQIALGLARAHELGVVHRDIKPANIHLIQRGRDADFVKILDFGVARIEQDARITGQDMIVGTPEYIAPEQIRSASPTFSSDLYSLGCLLFEMLTGKIPFDGKTTVLLVKHINDPAPPPSSVNPRIPREVDALVLKLMQKRPEDRHRDAYHLVQELQSLLDAPSMRGVSRQNLAAVGSEPPPSQPPARPSRIDNEEEGWERTLRLYRQLQRDAAQPSSEPIWLAEAIATVEQIISEVRLLRKQLEKTAALATEQEELERSTRGQIGRAIDELLQDDSKLGGQIAELQAQLAPAEPRLDAALHAVVQGASELPKSLRIGEPVTAAQLASAQELVRGCSELTLARDILGRVRTRLSRKESERKDLRFQMAQLKQRLDQANRASTVDQQLWHEEADRLSAQIQTKLEIMTPIGQRISAHFNANPALRARISAESGELTLS
jgi:eukaryotic-like serine/threonine-protein kinase